MAVLTTYLQQISASQSKLIDRQKWLEEGFVIQNLQGEYILGQGAFSYGSKARPYSLYHPDFFFTQKKAWIYPALLCKFNKKQFFDFLFLKERKIIPIRFENSSLTEIPTFTGVQSFGERQSKFTGNFKPDWYKRSNQKQINLFKFSKKPLFSLYHECFAQARQAMQGNLFQKVTPAFCETFFNTAPVLNLIQNLFKNTFGLKHGFLYGCWSKKSGILGFTPELLFSISGNDFSTMALAGTARQNSASLFTDKKNLKEHELVLKNIEENLINLVNFQQKNKSEMLFPPLKHLRTDLSGKWISKFDFEKLCNILHPSPAVGGYPQKQAWLWLKKQKSQKNRSFFSAPFAFFENKRHSFCLVALRALEWNSKKSWIFSGSGWIKESLLQNEWLELALKRQQVKSFFKVC